MSTLDVEQKLINVNIKFELCNKSAGAFANKYCSLLYCSVNDIFQKMASTKLSELIKTAKSSGNKRYNFQTRTPKGHFSGNNERKNREG